MNLLLAGAMPTARFWFFPKLIPEPSGNASAPLMGDGGIAITVLRAPTSPPLVFRSMLRLRRPLLLLPSLGLVLSSRALETDLILECSGGVLSELSQVKCPHTLSQSKKGRKPKKGNFNSQTKSVGCRYICNLTKWDDYLRLLKIRYFNSVHLQFCGRFASSELYWWALSQLRHRQMEACLAASYITQDESGRPTLLELCQSQSGLDVVANNGDQRCWSQAYCFPSCCYLNAIIH